ncbi:MAG TPA: NADH-quinone oxidoreductase subunit NuoE, partial [Thiohalobacter sp.]|nr:NADH-quinone oxidoreductase subunit NuoE [Thiohalobacter sp.]
MTETTQQPAEYELPAEVKTEIDHWLTKYPAEQKRSAVLSALHAIQEQEGWIRPEHMDAVAAYLEMAPVSVYEVASFYSMIETRQVGRNTVAMCANISCMLCGADDLIAHVEQKLGIRRGESTADGRIYLKLEEECLAACAGAPMMAVNGHYHENLTVEKVDRILDE